MCSKLPIHARNSTKHSRSYQKYAHLRAMASMCPVLENPKQPAGCCERTPLAKTRMRVIPMKTTADLQRVVRIVVRPR